MRKMFKAAAFALAGATALAACGSCGNRPTGGSGGADTLNIAFVEAGYGRVWLERIVEAFKAENPGVTVNLEGDSGMTAKISTRLQNNSELPSVFFALETNWQLWALEGYLEPLDDLYATDVDGRTYEDRVNDDYLDYGKVDGTYYATGWSDGVTGIVYNASMFEAYGWEIPETVDDLIALCAKIKTDTNGAIAPFAWGGQVAAYWDYVVKAWWCQYDGIEKVKTFLKFEKPEVFESNGGRLKALEAFETLIGDSTNSVEGAMSMNHIQSQLAFLQGKAAMIVNGDWIETEMANSMPDGFRMKMMKTPYIDSAHKLDVNYTASGDFAVIPKNLGAEEKALAKKFLAFMAKEDMCRIFTEETGSTRPFEYSVEEIYDGLTEFQQSVMDIYFADDIYNFHVYSDSYLKYNVFVSVFPLSGSPYADVLDDGAQNYIDKEVAYVNANWTKWVAESY